MQALTIPHWLLNASTMNDEHDDARSYDAPFQETDLPEELKDVLADPHGRSALVYLSRREGSVDLDELSRGVVGLVTGESTEEVSDTSARQVRTWLHHGHLPVLDEHGVVAYDSGSGTVTLLDRDVPFEELDSPPPGRPRGR